MHNHSCKRKWGTSFFLDSLYHFWQKFYWTDSNTQDWSRGKKITANWQKLCLASNTNLHYNLISEQILVKQASWYTENPAISLLMHLLPQHGAIHGDFVKIWEQTLLWLNQRMKTNLFTTCWGILAATALDGLGCIGELIANFIGLMTALGKEIIRSGTMANQMTLMARRIVGML